MAPSAMSVAAHPLRWRALPRPGAVVGLVAGLICGIGVGAMVVHGGTPALARAPHGGDVGVPFTPQAIAVAARETALLDAPSRGRPIVTLPPGTVVSVGGAIRVAAGLIVREVYWVRAEVAGEARYGFLPVGAASLAAGSAPRLDVRGIDVAALLTPNDGVSARPPADGGAHAGGSAGGNGDGRGVSDALAAVSAPGSAARANGASAPAALTIAWLPDTVRRWEAHLVRASERYGVDANLLAIIALVESGGNPRAVSPSGAVGLMQVMPATAADIASQRGIAGFSADQLYDPATAIDFGAWYLAKMLGTFGRASDPDWATSVALAAAAYNAGPGSVQRYLAGSGALPAEAQRYRRWVGSMWGERAESASPGFDAWWAAGGRILVEAAEGIAVSG